MNAHAIPVREHDLEASPGLPGQLPEGEFIVWQGRPDANAFSRHVLKTRWVLAYFGILAVWAVVAGIADARSAASLLFSAGVLAVLATLAIGFLEAFAWGVEKTTLYTITNARIVMRIGVALSVTLNLPFSQIENAAVTRVADGTGNIAIKLKNGQRLAWATLWPHARPWRFSRPEPALRMIADAEEVATLLATELQRALHGRAASQRGFEVAGSDTLPAYAGGGRARALAS